MKKLIAFALIAISGLGLSACGSSGGSVDKNSDSYHSGYNYSLDNAQNLGSGYCNDSTFNSRDVQGWGGPTNEGDWIAGCLQGWRDSQ